MRIALFGVSCVGKSTIGKRLAELLDYSFVDFDAEVSTRMEMSISRLKSVCFNEHEYRQKVKHILPMVLLEYQKDLVLAMPPSGLFREYKIVFDKNPDILTIALMDKSIHILNRLVFTDDNDSIVDEEVVNDDNWYRYYHEIQEDARYFGTTLRKAKLQFNIDGRGIDDAAIAIADLVERYEGCCSL